MCTNIAAWKKGVDGLLQATEEEMKELQDSKKIRAYLFGTISSAPDDMKTQPCGSH